ncbi:TraR/DksA family transcriptional regulator [Halobacteriovorax sp.]|uniref:TraR/DksA family transcriptional regulator n=1 Tax=Halobacteriovorax sp. TaxID=2020862 RepID=UPI00356A7FB4
MKRENSYLSDKQIGKLKDTLLAEKERIYNKSQNSESYCLDKNELSDPVDEASVNVQTSQEIRFRNRDIFYLKKINKALTKIEDGVYGLCQECDAEINFERLMARTTAELCIGCKEEAELSEKNNFIQRKSKSLGKTLSELSSK